MNKLCCLIIMFFTCRVCDAQIPDWEWAKSAACGTPGVGLGEGTNVASDLWGNVYITGSFFDSTITFDTITINSPNPVATNVFLTKYDSSGNVLWVRNAGGTGSGVAYGITCDKWGNIYLTGVYRDGSIWFGSDTLGYMSGLNVFLVKYNSSGNAIWAENAGGSGHDWAKSVTTDTLGNIFITGYFFSDTIQVGSLTLANSGNISFSDFFVAKYDTSGNTLWAKNANGGGDDEGHSVSSDRDGNSYVTGYFVSTKIIFDADTLNRIGAQNMFIAKYDPSGNVIWAKSFADLNGDIGQSIAASKTNGFCVTGYYGFPFIVFGSDTLFSTGNTDGFLTRFDSSGNVLWAKRYSGGVPYNMISDSSDNIYFTGLFNLDSMTFDNIILYSPVSVFNFDPMFAVKYDFSGNAAWAKALSSGADDQNGLAAGPNNSIYIGGDFMIDPFIVGNDTLIQSGLEDIFVAKLHLPSSAGIQEIKNNDPLILYPNPANDEFTFSGLQFPVEITLYNVLGKEILSHQLTTVNPKLKIVNLDSGIYFYEVRNKNGVIKKGKVVKD